MQGSVAELDFMLADAGIPVVYGAVTVFGLLDVSPIYSSSEGGIQIVGRITKLGIRDGAISPMVDDMLTVGGKTRHVLDLGDPDADGLRWLQLVEG
jgi:hypothetical protein